MLKGIFVAAAHQERKLISISLEEVAEAEPVALRFMRGGDSACYATRGFNFDLLWALALMIAGVMALMI